MDAAADQKQERIGVLEELLSERFSCRAFQPQNVARPTIERILNAAQKTASWCNSQPWRLEITSGAATGKFRDVMYSAASNAVGIPRGDKEGYAKQALQNFNFFGAPHVAIVHTDEALGVYGAIDCGGYVTSFMLAAQALGVATVPQAALAFHSEVVRKHFGLSDDRRVVCGISFGYPDRDHRANSYRTTRAGIADTVTFVDT
jgi:nitroreductase